ncbi:acyl-CoA synthetase FdrA [Acidipropionibacterium acidipropionici]|uniref:acyl-CoA synthetase FdrA n=1 Tax=Acidipropionibacterium acidipropionici TaxID=1748 RepID=UPI00110A2D1F|nr:acyl-CoA synthetase FdrA [Acidipropionibacterium acidipropionici]QCV96012.1 acyl-CoA synthetase FdrA [Acidipropionibacterium acidipropionici]
MLTTIVQPNHYQDSVALMVLSRAVSDLPGVTKASAMMGTPANRAILADTGFDSPELATATPADLVIGIDAVDEQSCADAAARADELLADQGSAVSGAGTSRVHSLARARTLLPDANLALVSVPGVHAAAEAHRLLDAGLNVMLFSDNVSLDDEVALKSRADELGLLVMGPDCGTAAFAGVPLAFGNVCAPGSIGVVGASGTGTQEIMTQVDRLGAGVSHAIGLGGRDLSAAVGGRTALTALRALDADPGTDVIVLVSKPPAPQVRARVEEVAQRLSTPVVTIFIGSRGAGRDGNITAASTLADAAARAVELAGVASFTSPDPEKAGLVGLFTGGTLADEAGVIVSEELGLDVALNSTDPGVVLDAAPDRIIDLGDDVYTQGRPHPMIDPALRAEKITEALAEPSTAVLLLDVVIGHGSAADPAGAIAEPIREGLENAARQGRAVRVVASVCGTSRDEQGLDAQISTLTDAGVTVLGSNAAASRHAAALIRRARSRREIPTPPPAPPRIADLLAGPKVVNVGLAGFAEDLAGLDVPVVQWSWAPPAGGDPRLARIVERLLAR